MSAGDGVDMRAAALAAGYRLATSVAGEGPLRVAELTPGRLRTWAEALAALHALPAPRGLPSVPYPGWLGRVAQPWPVDVAPLLAQAAWMGKPPEAVAASEPCICHRRWWLRHVRFDGQVVAAVGGWEAAGVGDPAGDLASVEVGLVADGASAASAESFAAAFAHAYAEAAGAVPRGLAPWRIALAGEQLAGALAARQRGERGTAAGSVVVWARLLGRLLTARRQD